MIGGSKVERSLAGTFDVTVNLTDRRGIKINGYIYSDDTPADINRRIDQAQDALDRQAIRTDLVNKEAQIAGHVANLENMAESYDALVALQKDGTKLTSQQKLYLLNHAQSVQKAKEQIASLESAIAAGKRKLAAP